MSTRRFLLAASLAAAPALAASPATPLGAAMPSGAPALTAPVPLFPPTRREATARPAATSPGANLAVMQPAPFASHERLEPPAPPNPGSTTARRAPGTEQGDILIEPIPASTQPPASASGAAARRAAVDSAATVQLGDARSGDESTRLLDVTEEGGRTCREYEQTVIVDGTPVQAVSTVCRERDGTWRLAE